MTDETNLNDQENVQENQEQQENQVETNVEAKAEETPAAEVETNEVETNEVVEKTEPVENTVAPVAEEELITEKPKRTVKTVDDNFDWDTIGKKHDLYSGTERKQLEDIYDKTLSSIVEQQVVDGTIVGMNNREVVVNIGFKSDAVVSLNEFRDIPDLKVGDKVDVYVESQENLTGQLILSHKKAKLLKAWDRVNEALEKDEIITGYVKCRTKGGLIVDVFGIEAFLPGSQIDVKPIRDYDIFVGKNMEFKVVKVNNEFKNVVVSHKALIED